MKNTINGKDTNVLNKLSIDDFLASIGPFIPENDKKDKSVGMIRGHKGNSTDVESITDIIEAIGNEGVIVKSMMDQEFLN